MAWTLSPARLPGPRPNLLRDETAAASVVITVAGVTVGMAGLVAWFFAGAFMAALHNVPEIGDTLGFIGFLTMLTVVGILVALGIKKWG